MPRQTAMLMIRNIAFAVAFYGNNALWFLLAFVAYPLPTRVFMRICKWWALSSDWLFRTLIGVSVEVRGRQNIPLGGAVVAAKHQSAWETIALLPLVEKPTFIFKRELSYIPFLGWHLWRAGQIPVERGGRADVLSRLVARARGAIERGQQVIIFPEGTRRAVGAPPDYKLGIAQLYRSLNAPVVPVALNAGLAWPRRSFLKYPYPVIVEFLEPIPPGMPPRAFFRLLQERIETATAQLVEEARGAAGVQDLRRDVTQSSKGS